MSSVNDILSSIMLGRFVAERARADHLARVLSEVEDLVREMRPAPEPVTIERGNTADLADLAEMRDTLDGADYAPTPDGLRGMAEDLDRRHNEVASAKDGLMLIVSDDDSENFTLDRLVTAAAEALKGARAARDSTAEEIVSLRSEVARLGRAIVANSAEHERVKREQGRLWLEAQDSIAQRQCDNAALRAEIAALTPGPWVRLGDAAPNLAETVLMWSGVQGTPAWMQVFYGTTVQSIAADYLWRRIPAGLLDVPAPTVTP